MNSSSLLMMCFVLALVNASSVRAEDGPLGTNSTAPNSATENENANNGQPASPQIQPGSDEKTKHLTYPIDRQVVLDELEKRLLRSLVKCKTKSSWSYGFLAKDRRTVILEKISVGAGQTVHLEGSDGKPISATVERVQVGKNRQGNDLEVLIFSEELPFEPLEVSDSPPGIGTAVFSLSYEQEGGPHFELFESMIQGSFRRGFVINPMGETSMPVVDEAGKIIGVYAHHGICLQLEEVLSNSEAPSSPYYVRPTFGFRLGGQFGGFVEASHGAFVFDIEGGVRLWDDLSLLAKVGLNVHSGSQLIKLQGGDQGEGPGVVAADLSEFQIELELKYGFVLDAGSNLILHIAVGGHYSWLKPNAQGMAAFSMDPACNPASGACEVIFRDPDGYLEDEQHHAVGPMVGLDMEYNHVLIGYRFIPGALSYNHSDSHIISMGFIF